MFLCHLSEAARRINSTTGFGALSMVMVGPVEKLAMLYYENVSRVYASVYNAESLIVKELDRYVCLIER